MSASLLRRLALCNLKAAAFDFAKQLGGGVYRSEFMVALDLFVKLPCPETAVNLVSESPDFLPYLYAADDTFVRNTPIPQRGTMLQDYEEWMKTFDNNLKSAAAIHSYLKKEAAAARVRIGFHHPRSQSTLYTRLRQIGIWKRFILPNRRQVLRDAITGDASAFRAVVDLVCVHGMQGGRERFWNALGREFDAQLHLQSEVLFDVGNGAEAFMQLVSELPHSRT